MAYFILTAVVLGWFVHIKIKGKLSWHSILEIVFSSLILTDLPDILLCYHLRLFSLYLKMFSDTNRDIKNALLLSDLVIMPLMLVIYTYYFAKYRKWWIPLVYPITLTMIELLFLKLHLIEYHHFSWIYTFLMYCMGAALFAWLAHRYINYNPPLPEALMIAPASYVIMAFPPTLFGTLLELFQWRPGIFTDGFTDNWVIAVGLGLLSAVIACIGFLVFKSRKSRYWVLFFVGIIHIAINAVLIAKGWCVYHHWNTFFQILLIICSTIILLLYYRWETRYRDRIAHSVRYTKRPLHM